MTKVIAGAARTARKRLGLSQAAVANRLDVTMQHYSWIDRGIALPSLPTFFRMAAVLKISPSEPLGKTDVTPTAANSACPREPADAGDAADELSDLTQVSILLGKASPDSLEAIDWLLDILEQIAGNCAARADEDE